ncbi:predicted protein [Arabidopsis lyrata subsp. lyrata]|uniref:Predicted protein n=1 Tax=Arabidopsis lyrata subsp. lyrata TaxID=81972 RepID=D7LMG5_ARALL|nr:predicted protein [Arabidopsis lyrata subsp. lyrata]
MSQSTIRWRLRSMISIVKLGKSPRSTPRSKPDSGRKETFTDGEKKAMKQWKICIKK